MPMTRRQFAHLALGAVPVAGFVSSRGSLMAWQQPPRPNSKFAGVQIGLNAPYNFGSNNLSGEEVLTRTVQLGVNALELRSQPIEKFMGWVAPTSAPDAAAAGQTLAQFSAAALRVWRHTADIAKAREFRRTYEAAGVAIEIVKFDNIYAFDDRELNYAFTLAKAVGARAISCEISAAGTARVGTFADKHQLLVGYHGHATTTPAHWETAFSQAKFNGANLDIGHFVAGNNTSPVPFLTEHHARITHLHIKDRLMNNGANTAFGKGDTPIAEVLRLLRDRKWTMQATIEFEYPVPAGSDRMAEMAKCLDFCRTALVG